MIYARMGLIAGLSLMAGHAWAFDTTQTAPAFLCEFADTAKAFAFRQGQEGEWEGLGQLQDWSVTVQEDGLVARNGEDVLILDDDTASLLQGGQLVRGTCVDAGAEFAQLLGDNAEETDAPRRRRGPEALIAEVLSVLDPGNWDEAQVAQLIDELDMDAPAKMGLKAELRAAARDPARIAGLARRIRAAFEQELAASSDLRARLKDAQQELDDVTQALEAARRDAQTGAAQAKAAEARARTAESANARAVEQIAALRSALNAAATEEDRMRAALDAAIERLAQANKRIAKLGGIPLRP